MTIKEFECSCGTRENAECPEGAKIYKEMMEAGKARNLVLWRKLLKIHRLHLSSALRNIDKL